MPGRAGRAARPDHGDRLGSEQPRHAARLGAVLAGADDPDGGLRLLDRERQLDVAVGHLAADLEARRPEHREHAPVARQHVRDEALHPALAGRRLHVLEQQRAEPAPLVRVLHDDGDLRVLGAREAGVAAHAHDLVAQQPHDRGALVVVDGGEPLHVARRQRPDHGEEAVVDGVGAQARVEGAQPVGVARGDRPYVHRPAVGEHGVGLPVPRVRGRRGVGHALIVPGAQDAGRRRPGSGGWLSYPQGRIDA